MPEERKLVTVVFADVVGSTAFGSSKDPEVVRSAMGSYFERMKGIAETYGGTVEKFIGDAVMAVWGTPTAQEDDAERAVRTALDLVTAVAALGEEIGAPELALRAGVLTGEAADCIDDIEGGANRPLRVVFVGGRCAPDGHDRIADELLDRAAVALDHVAGDIEVAAQELPDLLVVAALRERREADEVGEEDADEASLGGRGLACGRRGRRGGGGGGGGGRPALAAELLVPGQDRATRGAARARGRRTAARARRTRARRRGSR